MSYAKSLPGIINDILDFSNILLDIMMPDMEGYRLKPDEKTEEIRFAVKKYLSIPHLYTRTGANVLTVSIGGITMMPVQLSGHSDLAKKADDLLYQAK